MSRYHGDQYWTEIRQHAKYGWRDLSDDDLDTIDAMRRDREVRSRDQRSRARRSKWSERRELEN
jgi:hypothetical protein